MSTNLLMLILVFPIKELYIILVSYRIKQMDIQQLNRLFSIFGITIISMLIVFGVSNHLNKNTEEATIHEQLVNKVEEDMTPTFTQNLISGEMEGKPSPQEYIMITDSCGVAYNGVCVNIRSSPTTDAPVVFKARKGIVLKVINKVTSDDGQEWYEITFSNEWVRYPERVKSSMYVSGEYVTHFVNEGTKEFTASSTPPTNKRIVIDRSDQMLYAYENDEIFMSEKVSTGIFLTPTPRGNFRVFKKSPSRYMQGPISGITDHYYDLPGVPWNLYFTEQGAVIHGAYWHNSFGKVWSNGCVNMPPASAEKLYNWADLGTPIVVRD